jgi:hypothetical protein
LLLRDGQVADSCYTAFVRGALAALVILFCCGAARADITIQVVGGERGRLEHADSELGAWSTLCETPCTIRGPRDGVYRIAGFRTESRPIRLSADTSDVTLRAHVGVRAEAPLSVGVIGAVLLLSGAVLEGAALIGFGDATREAFQPTWPTPVAIAGAATMFTGLVALVVGFTMHELKHTSWLREERTTPLPPLTEPRYTGGWLGPLGVSF